MSEEKTAADLALELAQKAEEDAVAEDAANNAAKPPAKPPAKTPAQNAGAKAVKDGGRHKLLKAVRRGDGKYAEGDDIDLPADQAAFYRAEGFIK